MRLASPVLGALRAFALITLVVALAACSRSPTTGVGNLGPGAAAPGSQQEFLVTVGDRVFFGSQDGNLYAARLSDGKELWKFTDGKAFTADAAAFYKAGAR